MTFAEWGLVVVAALLWLILVEVGALNAKLHEIFQWMARRWPK